MIEFGTIESLTDTEAVVQFDSLDTSYTCALLLPLGGEVKPTALLSQGDSVVCWLESGKNIVLGTLYKSEAKGSVKGVYSKLVDVLKTFKVFTSPSGGASMEVTPTSLQKIQAIEEDLKTILN